MASNLKRSKNFVGLVEKQRAPISGLVFGQTYVRAEILPLAAPRNDGFSGPSRIDATFWHK